MFKFSFLPIIALVTFTMISSVSLYAQSDGEQKEKELYKTAEDILSKADKALKNDDWVEAEKLYAQALNTYPIANGFSALTSKKMEIGDFRGANKVWDNIIAKLKERPQVLTLQFTTLMGLAKLSYVPSSNFIKGIRTQKASSNFYNGDIKVAHNEMMKLKEEGALGAKEWATLGETSIQVGEYSVTQEAISALTKLYEERKNKSLEMGYSTQTTPLYLTAKLALAKGNFSDAIKYSNLVFTSDKSINKMWVATANLIVAKAELGLGNLEKAKSYISLATKSPVYSESSPDITFTRGLIALAEKDFSTAITKFNSNLSWKPGYLKPGSVYEQQVTYTKRAEAYIGLTDFVNAKKSFETALIYFPDYEPAIIGLAKIDGSQASIRKEDKAGPEIKIQEPTNTRGLKIVSASNDVMVKGMAVDPSGLKEVTINGQSIFTKEDGNFWGSIKLKDGLNKVLIVATDLAGNTSQQDFEIEKSTVVSQTTPIAVTQKQGKNFAMFIAAQNYDDIAIPSLDNPIVDAIKLKLILKNGYNFDEENIYTLFNPQKDDFKKKFLELKEALQPEDNLVIFYAGHGIWVDKEKKGYWLLTDAQRNNVNSWLSNKQVLDMIAELPSRNTLLITDACFSGSVFKTRSIDTDIPPAIREMENKITRVAITSGNDTEVPDVSVFMKHLIKALSENKEKYLSAQKMFVNQIIEAVMSESKTEPRYGTLELAGHIGGDFIFTKK